VSSEGKYDREKTGSLVSSFPLRPKAKRRDASLVTSFHKERRDGKKRCSFFPRHFLPRLFCIAAY
jgi:hypothetical protein